MTGGHWNAHARQWSLIASPLRPHRDDVGNLRQAIDTNSGLHLLLGLTPEYAALFNRLVAVDCSAAMIAALWPAQAPGKMAIQADWLGLPLGDASFHSCIGDGSLNVFSFPSQYPRFFDQLARVLRPGGRIALRVFVRPDAGEACDAVCASALQARITSFHAFKWRLAMAIAHETGDSNVRVAAIREAFMRRLPERKALAVASGWSVESIDTIDAYAKAGASYSFPTLAHLRRAVPDYLETVDLKYGRYELAERCPMLVLQRTR